MNTNPRNAHDWQNTLLGRYRLQRLLGRGGMGEVWLAEDTQLRRHVAIKLLPIVYQMDREYLRDFEREAQAAAALEHPHILPVHDFGEQQMADDELVTYLVIPYISGGSLLDRLNTVEGNFSPEKALSYLQQAAEAIDYAHAQNVLHRDIKPANMLLQQEWLFLADFGIAKLLTHSALRSHTNAGAGTPEYMAPEQIQGKAVLASDRYSFAVTAYQLLTKHLPFKGETVFQTMLKQMSEPPPSPRRFHPTIPEEAAQALLQGLAKVPEERFASCMALVRALESSYSIRPVAPIESGTRATSKGPFTSSAHQSPRTPEIHMPRSAADTTNGADTSDVQQPGTESSVFLQPTVIATSHAISHTTSHSAEHQQTQQGSSERAMVREPSASHGRISRRTVLIGGGAVALAGLGGVGLYTVLHRRTGTSSIVTTRKPVPGPQKAIPGVPQLSLTAHTKSVSAARWDASGRYLATAGEDSYVMVWDLADYLQTDSTSIQSLATPTRSWKLASPIIENGMSWSADGRTLAVVTGENKIVLFPVFDRSDTPQSYQNARVSDSSPSPAFTAVSCSPTTETFATISYAPGQTQQQIALWQMHSTNAPIKMLHSDATGTARTAVIDATHPYNSAATLNGIGWSPDGALVAGHTNFGTVTIWQAQTGTIQQALTLPERPTKEKPLYVLGEIVAWAPGTAPLLAVSNTDVATIWDVRQKKLLLTLNVSDPVPFITSLSWSSNGKYVAASYAGSNRIYIWDVPSISTPMSGTHAETFFFPPPGSHVHSETITDVSWSPDGRSIASASGDTTVVVWRVS